MEEQAVMNSNQEMGYIHIILFDENEIENGKDGCV